MALDIVVDAVKESDIEKKIHSCDADIKSLRKKNVRNYTLGIMNAAGMMVCAVSVGYDLLKEGPGSFLELSNLGLTFFMYMNARYVLKGYHDIVDNRRRIDFLKREIHGLQIGSASYKYVE